MGIRHGIGLRKFPYPFRAACTIANDIDRMDWETFVYVRKLLNLKMGLEIADSFWMYSVKPDTDDAFTYFEGLSENKGQYAEKLIKLIRLGYVDCLHTYGNFSQKGGFSREHAKKALEELNKQSIEITTWVDHGDSHNFQNISSYGDAPWDVSADGNKTKVLEYHTDLLINYGVKYIWDGRLSLIIGQDRKANIIEFIFSKGVHPLNVIRQIRDYIVDKVKGKNIISNRLLVPKLLRDGRKAYSFCRYGAWEKGVPSALPELLSEKNLKKLIKVKGYMIVYNHLGKETCEGKGLHDDSVQAALYRLKKEYNSGNIWVTTTSKLLHYNMIRGGLRWEQKGIGDNIIINITHVEDPVLGRILPEQNDLQGITFCVPAPEKTKLLIRGNEIDSTIIGQRTISIALKQLENRAIEKVLGKSYE